MISSKTLFSQAPKREVSMWGHCPSDDVHHLVHNLALGIGWRSCTGTYNNAPRQNVDLDLKGLQDGLQLHGSNLQLNTAPRNNRAGDFVQWQQFPPLLQA